MSVLPIGINGESGSYRIERSVRFNSADSSYFNRTPGSAGNRQKWTISFWVKRTTLGLRQEVLGNTDSSALNGLYIEFLADDTLQVGDYASAGWSWQFTTTQVFRDPSAWYHIVLSVDTTQATNTNRIKIYVNGTQITTFSTATYPSQNFSSAWNTTQPASIGRNGQYTSLYFNGYLTDVYNIDGSQLTPSSFGENDTDTGVWKPKAYTGSYGTNGFKLTFSDNSGTTATTLGKDSSGNGNNWTPNNFSVTAGAGNDSLVDTPTPYGSDTGAGGEVRGNYATLNPTIPVTVTLVNGNLDASASSDNNIYSTIETGKTGKWYAEFTVTAVSSVWPWVGTRKADSVLGGNGSAFYPGYQSGGEAGYLNNGNKYVSATQSAYGNTFTTNDVIGIAVDCDNGAVYFSKNGVFQNSGSPTSGSSKTGAAATWTGGAQSFFVGVAVNTSATGSVNFGQRPFAYTAPSGYKALCTTNLPTPAIGATSTTRADDYFNTVLYTGDGTKPRTITGVGFQPDLVWIKQRNTAGTIHFIQDAVRGVTSTDSRSLSSNATTAETNYYTTNGGMTAFTSDGFTTNGGSTNNNINANGATYVTWNWKGNGAGVSNTQGTITSTVSANTTSGFSIVTYTGTGSNGTIGHGLGVAPQMIIVKSRSNTYGWVVWHQSIYNSNSSNYLVLSSTAAAGADSSYFTTTAPTSSVFSIGTAVASNQSSQTFVAYCFAPVAGYSAFGSYTGNGSADGPFIYTGFTPKYVLIKQSNASGTNWRIVTLNTSYLSANTADAEYDSPPGPVRAVSNGIKIVGTGGDINGSGYNFIYAAFAEVPFKYALAK